MVILKNRQRIFKWHHWCGLIAGIFLLMMSATGSLLVFSEEMEASADLAFVHTDNADGKVSYDASFDAIRAKYPDWEIRLYDHPKRDEAIIYELRKSERAKKLFVHPVSGNILHTIENSNGQFHRQLLLLHYTWFAGTTGKIAVFFTGVLFVFSLITGLYVYRRSFVKVLTFKTHLNTKTRRSLNSSLHRIVGVCSLAFNLVAVVTGLTLSSQIVMKAIDKSAKVQTKKTGNVTSIDQVRDQLTRDYRNFEIHLIRIRAGSDQVQVSGKYANDPSYYGHYASSFTFGSDGKINNKLVLAEQPLSKRLVAICGPLHFGNYGGIALKIFYSLLGVTPGLLSITGFIVWQNRRKATHHKMKNAK